MIKKKKYAIRKTMHQTMAVTAIAIATLEWISAKKEKLLKKYSK